MLPTIDTSKVYALMKLITSENNLLVRRAAEIGSSELVQQLIYNGANIHAEREEALRLAAKNGHTETVKVLLDNGADIRAENNEALRVAAANGHEEIVRLLLDRGADIHVNNDEPLRSAIKNGLTETAAVLINYGADINNIPDALMLAKATGHTETLKLVKDCMDGKWPELEKTDTNFTAMVAESRLKGPREKQ